VCRIGYGSGLGGTACNVSYDGVGNIIEQVTRTGVRRLEYFASGNVRRITEGPAQASFRYDPFGAVQELDVTGVGVSDTRHDRRYGGLIERREQVVNGTTTTFISRNIPGPGGIVASRRGKKQDWIFGFGELRGNRFFTNQDGAFVQEVGYQPFGEGKSSGASPSATDYTSYQWNGGDALAAFTLSHLGARLYDAVIGRFLSRDPMRVFGTATTANPYAFAANDPWNAADPSGLDCIGTQECLGEPTRPPWEIAVLFARGIADLAARGIAALVPRSSAAPPAPLVSTGPISLRSSQGAPFEGAATTADVVAQSSAATERVLDFYSEYGSYSERVTRSIDVAKRVTPWLTRGAGLVELGIKYYAYTRDSSGENLGKVYLSAVKLPALEWGGLYGKAVALGISLGESTWDKNQEVEEELPFLEGRINRLDREIKALETRLRQPIGGAEVESNVDFYYNHSKWEEHHLPTFLWGKLPAPPLPASEPLHGDQCVAIYECNLPPIP
jgi:RHS repeat-associated protein